MRAAFSLFLLLFGGMASGESTFPSACRIWEFTYTKPGIMSPKQVTLLHGPTLSVLGPDPTGTEVSRSVSIIIEMQTAKSFPAEFSTDEVTLSSNPGDLRKARCVVWGTEASVVAKYLTTDLRAEMTKEVQAAMAGFLDQLKKLNADEKAQRLDELLDAIKNNPDVVKALKEATK